jgi:hypothetical protein
MPIGVFLPLAFRVASEFHRNRGAGPKRTMNTINEKARTKMTAYLRTEAIVVSLQQRKGRRKCCAWKGIWSSLLHMERCPDLRYKLKQRRSGGASYVNLIVTAWHK